MVDVGGGGWSWTHEWARCIERVWQGVRRGWFKNKWKYIESKSKFLIYIGDKQVER